MSDTATYMYCLVKAARRPAPARLPGVPGSSAIEAVPAGTGLWAIISDVPLQIYGEDALTERLRDVDWVSAAALAHDAVIEHYARRPGATTVPLKMFTLFSSPDRAAADVAGRREAVDAAAKRIAGAQEWGIRVTFQRTASPRREPGRQSSGTAFLAARKQAREDARTAVIAAAEAAEALYARLAPLARETRRREDAPPGAVSPPLLDAAFLVPAARRARFEAEARKAAAQCEERGAVVTLSGPWPAYNFVQDNG